MTCPICSEDRLRDAVEVCPICGQPGGKPEIDAIARQWLEEWFDRQEDHRVFGTPLPKETVQ